VAEASREASRGASPVQVNMDPISNADFKVLFFFSSPGCLFYVHITVLLNFDK
jgi:hypothetical protein